MAEAPGPPDPPPPRSAEDVFADFLNRSNQPESGEFEELYDSFPELVEELREQARQWQVLAPLDRTLENRSRPLPALEGTVLDDYRLIRLLGRGGMGEVWESEQISLRRRVAVKLLRADRTATERQVSRFQREAHAGGRLTHPGLVAVYSTGVAEGIHYIVQELIEEGRTLHDVLSDTRRRVGLPDDYYEGMARLFLQVTEALQAAHDAGVIHRDIKPSNILITPDGRPKVTDFGLARVEDEVALTVTGELSGTYCYMSPEQAMARRIELDSRTDVFSLAATLYEALTLRRAFDGDTAHQVIQKVMLVDPEEPRRVRSKIPFELSVICMKGLEKRREDRYPSMSAFGDDLRRFLTHRPILARPPGLLRQFQKWTLRHPTLSVAGGVLLVALIVISVLLARTLRAQRTAEQERAAAEQAREEEGTQRRNVLRVSDGKTLRDLEQQAEELWPIHPDQLPALTAWLGKAEALAAQQALHESFLVELSDPASEASASLTAEERAWWLDTLRELVEGLRRFVDPQTGTLADVRARFELSSTIAQRSIDDHREAWEEAVTEIAVSDLYDGLEIEPQVGLVPLGADPDSGLWEFWHMQSGARPGRDPETDRIEMTEEGGVVLVLLPGGTFTVGAQWQDPGGPRFDPQAVTDESPLEAVTLAPFFLSKFEMTQGQWVRRMGENPSRYRTTTASTPASARSPVEQVSWHDCRRTLRRYGLQMPTEAQWEYGARAGTETPWWCGREASSIGAEQAGNLADAFALGHGAPDTWGNFEPWNDGATVHAEVGRYRANDFGLHDVIGNVWEWCEDGAVDYDVPARQGDGLRAGPPEPVLRDRVCRGGSYDGTSQYARSSVRSKSTPDRRSPYLGVRPARALDGQWTR